MFITKMAFDPALKGKAVALSGSLFDGNFIICKVNDRSLEIVGATSSTTVWIEDFEKEQIKMVVLHPQQNVVEANEQQTGFTRNVRSAIQVKVDNAHVESILKDNVAPLKLEEITRRMQEDRGHSHWNNNNSSGFIQHAMQCGKLIKKSGYGLYAYDWEASNND